MHWPPLPKFAEEFALPARDEGPGGRLGRELSALCREIRLTKGYVTSGWPTVRQEPGE